MAVWRDWDLGEKLFGEVVEAWPVDAAREWRTRLSDGGEIGAAGARACCLPLERNGQDGARETVEADADEATDDELLSDALR